MERLRFLWRIHHNLPRQFHCRRHNFQQIGVLTGICYGKGHAITNINTRWRNYNQYALYLSVHCTALRAAISAFVQRYLHPCPKISLSWPEDISARGFHAPINSANGFIIVKLNGRLYLTDFPFFSLSMWSCSRKQ